MDAYSYVYEIDMGRLACIRENTAAKKEVENEVIRNICTETMMCGGGLF